MHPATEHVLQFFVYSHLPQRLQEVSKPFAELARAVAERADNPETTVAVRKLLEAKDAAVRAVLVPAKLAEPSRKHTPDDTFDDR